MANLIKYLIKTNYQNKTYKSLNTMKNQLKLRFKNIFNHSLILSLPLSLFLGISYFNVSLAQNESQSSTSNSQKNLTQNTQKSQNTPSSSLELEELTKSCQESFKNKDKETLTTCLKVAEQNQSGEIYYLISEIYSLGIGTNVNQSQQINYLNKAAHLKYPKALTSLGNITIGAYLEFKNKNVGKNGIAYLEEASKLGDLSAKFALAKLKTSPLFKDIYEYNLVTANKELNDLYNQGFLEAGIYVALNHYQGIGTEVNKQQAIQTLNDLVAKKYPDALISLSEIYTTDEELKNPLLAYATFYAYANCNPSSKNFKKVEELKKVLPAKDVNKANNIGNALTNDACQ